MERVRPDFDALIIGAGFAGIYALHALRKAGFTARVIEKGGDVGGTWYWNRYPGARCDVTSMAYSYAFDDDLQQDWHWPHRYAYQPDILRYAAHVVERFDLQAEVPRVKVDYRRSSMEKLAAKGVWDVASAIAEDEGIEEVQVYLIELAFDADEELLACELIERWVRVLSRKMGEPLAASFCHLFTQEIYPKTYAESR